MNMTRKKPQKYAACSHFKSMNSYWTFSASEPSCNSSSQINSHSSDNFAPCLPSDCHLHTISSQLITTGIHLARRYKQSEEDFAYCHVECINLLVPMTATPKSASLSVMMDELSFKEYNILWSHTFMGFTMHLSLLPQFSSLNKSFLSIQRCHINNHLKLIWPHIFFHLCFQFSAHLNAKLLERTMYNHCLYIPYPCPSILF